MLQINTLTRLDLGVKQENLARDIYIDMNAWYADYPNGAITIWHKRNGDQTKYAVGGATFDRDTGILKWTPTEYDTFYVGQGIAEIRLTENDVIKKSKDIVTEVARSLMLGTGETLESGWQNIIDTISGYAGDAAGSAEDAEDAQEAAEDAQAAAEDARDAAEAAIVHAPVIDDVSGNWLVWDQENEEYVDTGVHAQGPQGEPGTIENVRATGIKMSITDDTTVYEAINARADKVDSAVTGNFAGLDSNGNLTDSGHKHSDYLTPSDITGKADKVDSAISGNFAALDANGNLTDSGHKHGDYLTAHQDISGKADKVDSAVTGNFAGLDANGNLTDSGYDASDFVAAGTTLRDVPFSIATGDWTLSSGMYEAEYTTAYATASCKYMTYFSNTIREYVTDDITDELKSGGGGIILKTASLPTGTVTGIFRIFDTDDGKVPVLIEDTVVPVANGGTGESSLSGAQGALGITEINNKIIPQSITNLDNATSLGRYYYGVGTSNAPNVNYSGFVDVLSDSNLIYQIAINTLNDIYTRVYKNSAWTSWELLARNSTVTNLIKYKEISPTSDANSTVDLDLSGANYVVLSVYTSGVAMENVVCIPYLHSNNWRARLIHAQTGNPLASNARTMRVYYMDK